MSYTSTQIGSIALNMVENVPTGLSGALPAIITAKCQKVENYTGESVSASGFADKFYPAVLYYTVAELTALMQTYGVDASSIHLGDFSKSNGAGGNLEIVSKNYNDMGDKELQSLGRNINTYQAFYG